MATTPLLLRRRAAHRYLAVGTTVLAALMFVIGCSSSATSSNSSSSSSASGSTSSKAESLTTVRYVIQSGNFEVLPVYVAKYTGIAARHGIDLKFVTSQNPITPLVSGSADIGDPTASLVIEGFSQGYPVKVAGTMLAGNPQPLVVAPSMDIPVNSWPATFRALKGKVVGTTVLGGGLDNIMKYAMSLAGVDPKDGFTDLATGSGGAMGAAFKAHRIVAGLAAPPLAQIWSAQGIAKVAYDFTKAKGPSGLNAPANVVGVSEKFASKNPGAVRNFVEMLAEADMYMTDPSHLSEVVSIGIKYILPGQKRSIVTDATKALFPLLKAPCFTREQFNGAYDQTKVNDLLKKPVTYEEILDKSGQLPECS